MARKIDPEKCVGCGTCAGVCPVEAIAQQDDGKCKVDADKCVDCGACQGNCPAEAIEEA